MTLLPSPSPNPPSDEALFEERERWRVTLDAIGDTVISVDFRGRVNYLNKNAERMSGWTLAAAQGRRLIEVFPLLDVNKSLIDCPATRAIIENQRVAVESLCVLRARNAREIAIEASASPIHDKQGGVIGAVLVAHDVTALRDNSAKLARLALHDDLTGLPNRALLTDRVQRALARARRNKCFAAVLFLDLDDFKAVNDSLGHVVGDALLKGVSERLICCVRSSDTVSRYGGDEFIILLPDLTGAEEVARCIKKLRNAFCTPYQVGEHTLSAAISIGVATFPDDGATADDLIRVADAEMYEDKRSKKEVVSSAVDYPQI